MLYSPTLHELNESLHQIDQYKSNLLSLKSLFSSHIKFAVSFKTSTQDLFASLSSFLINNELSTSIAQFISIGSSIDNILDIYSKSMMNLFNDVSSFASTVELIDKVIEARNEKKKVYEYYKDKIQNIDINIAISNKIDVKYNKAKEDFDTICTKTYHQISQILSNQSSLISPILTQFISTQKDFYKNAYGIYNSFDSQNSKASPYIKQKVPNSVTYSKTSFKRSLTPEPSSKKESNGKYIKLKINQKPNYYYSKKFYNSNSREINALYNNTINTSQF